MDYDHQSIYQIASFFSSENESLEVMILYKKLRIFMNKEVCEESLERTSLHRYTFILFSLDYHHREINLRKERIQIT